MIIPALDVSYQPQYIDQQILPPPLMVNRFPNDRVNNFSDAIYAIAITLLVLEVKVPPAEDIRTFGVWSSLLKLTPSFIGLLISFFVTALYWRAHLMLAQFIRTYDNKLLWLNIWLLLFVVMLPFSTAFYSKNFDYNGAFIFYCVNLALIGIFNFWMVRVALVRTPDEPALDTALVSWMKFRAIVAPSVWLLSIPVAFISPLISRFFFVLIFVVIAIGERRYKKKPLAASPAVSEA
jgi:uncharacterized membrane protein